MIPIITTISAKKLIGVSLNMSFIDNKTAELWRSFSARRHVIRTNCSTEVSSLQVYDATVVSRCNPITGCKTSARVAVTASTTRPGGRAILELDGGMYAVCFCEARRAT